MTSNEATSDRPVARRSLLAGGAAIAGIALLKAEPAAASTGAMQYGLTNDSGADSTQLTSTTQTVGEGSLSVANSGTSGHAIVARVTNASNAGISVRASTAGTGHAVLGEATNGTSTNAAVAGTHAGDGCGGSFVQSNASNDSAPAVLGMTAGGAPGVSGFSYGTGIGVLGASSTGAAAVRGTNSSTGPAVYAVNTGGGVGVRGESEDGRGGSFVGGEAQVRLLPASGDHPAAGKGGDLFVDSSKRLWFCKGGTNWVKLA
jgi:hypothetical protein